MDLGLEGRRFAVRGGSRGLGRAVAEQLLREGASVVVLSRDPDAAARELGERATAVSGDLCGPADVERLAGELAGDGSTGSSSTTAARRRARRSSSPTSSGGAPTS